MGPRRLGLALVAIGLVGLLGLSILGAVGPLSGTARRRAVYGPVTSRPWWSGMYRWMHGGPGWTRWGASAAPSPSPGAEEVRVEVDEFSFSPSVLELRAGETVNLVLVNRGQLPHDLTIPALGFSLAVGPGETASAALTPQRPGSYGFFCSVPGHRSAGMVGTLVVM